MSEPNLTSKPEKIVLPLQFSPSNGLSRELKKKIAWRLYGHTFLQSEQALEDFLSGGGEKGVRCELIEDEKTGNFQLECTVK